MVSRAERNPRTLLGLVPVDWALILRQHGKELPADVIPWPSDDVKLTQHIILFADAVEWLEEHARKLFRAGHSPRVFPAPYVPVAGIPLLAYFPHSHIWLQWSIETFRADWKLYAEDVTYHCHARKAWVHSRYYAQIIGKAFRIKTERVAETISHLSLRLRKVYNDT